MSKIKIQNFGPVKRGCLSDDGYIDISKVLLFIGNQGSGKSTVTKLISTLTWIEKALVRGDFKIDWFKRAKFVNHYLTYHRIEHYIRPDTVIEYIGEAYRMEYVNKNLVINKIEHYEYALPQIMYVPAERNFLAYVKSPRELKMSSASLSEFLMEYNNALDNMKGQVRLPVNNVAVVYDKLNKRTNIKGEDYTLNLTEASSGFQSLVPLYVVSSFLSKSVYQQQGREPMNAKEQESYSKISAEIMNDTAMSDEQRRLALSSLTAKFNKQAFINIVEEPEQNLYPTSQWNMLQSLLEFNNMNVGNKLIMTTHSPYIINYLTHFIEAWKIRHNKNCTEEIAAQLDALVSLESVIDSNDVRVYQMNEADGTITKLSDYKGFPSDENYLNDALAESNDKFAQLLEIEDLCR